MIKDERKKLKGSGRISIIGIFPKETKRVLFAPKLAKSGTKNPYREGPLGVIDVGAYADVLLAEGNPVNDVNILAEWENNIRIIMKDGEIYKNTINLIHVMYAQ